VTVTVGWWYWQWWYMARSLQFSLVSRLH